MSWADALVLAARSVRRRAGRVSLTILAVALASALLVALTVITQSASTRVLKQLGKGGSITAIKVNAAEPSPFASDGGDGTQAGAPKDLQEATRQRIASMADVTSVLGVVAAPVAIAPIDPERIGGRPVGDFGIAFERLLGVEFDQPRYLPVSVVAGRLPAADSTNEVAVTRGYVERLGLDPNDQADVDKVVGTQVEVGAPRTVIPGDNGLRATRWTRNVVVGVAAQDAGDGQLIAPIARARDDIAWLRQGVPDPNFDIPTSDYAGLVVIAGDLDRLDGVRKQITGLGYATSAPEQLVQTVQRYLGVVNLVLGGIAVISLIIAALGITNALQAAVRERRREIGVLKAIGARDRDVLRWFLFEAGFVGFVGGAIGTALGIGAAAIMSYLVDDYLRTRGLTGVQADLPPSVLLVGLGGATILALVAGVLPALRASRLPARESVGGIA